jgi:hypothetical protein
MTQVVEGMVDERTGLQVNLCLAIQTATKKPFSPLSFKVLDARDAKAELKAKGDPEGCERLEDVLSLIDQQLNQRKP